MTGPDILAPFLGRWRTEMHLPDGLLEGNASFEWLERDGLLLVRSHTIGAALPPRAVAVIGHDDASGRWSMAYHDDRGVSRLYAMTFDGRNWTLQGKPRDFHQRFHGTIDGDRIEGAWEKSDDGVAWSEDFRITYLRVGSDR